MKYFSSMAKILVAYHSQTGNTRKMAEVVAKAAITDEVISQLEELGKTLAAGCEAGIF